MAVGAVSMMRSSEAWACAMRSSAWRRRSMSSSAKVSSPPVATTLPTTQKARPSRACSRHSKVSARPSPSTATQSLRRSGCSGSGVATAAIGAPTKSASSPPNIRRAERFIHSMPPSWTVTMPTSTESSTARVRSAWRSSCSRERSCSVTSSVTTDSVRRPLASRPGSTRVSSQRRPSSGWRTA